MSFNVELNPKGVIRLDRVKDKVNVLCLPNGQVRVRTSPEQAAKLVLSEMFPIGATFIISRSVFGNCLLERQPTRPGESAAERSLREFQFQGITSQDQFIVITGVTGTTADATVSGIVVNCLALYTNAKIQMDPIQTSGMRTTALSRTTPSGQFGLTATGSVSDGIKLKLLSLSITNGKVTGSIVYDSRPRLKINSNSAFPTSSGKTSVTLVNDDNKLPLLQTSNELPMLTLGSRLLVTSEIDSKIVVDWMERASRATLLWRPTQTYSPLPKR